MWRNLLAALFAFVTLAAVFLYLRDPYSDAPSATQRAQSDTGDQSIASQRQTSASPDSSIAGAPSGEDNPFSTLDEQSSNATTQNDIINQYADNAEAPDSGATDPDPVDDSQSQNADLSLGGIPVAELGIANWQSDAQFDALIAELDANPALLDAVLEQYRNTTDPGQLARLTQLLSRFDSSVVAAVAEDIARTGSTENRLAAINLLREVQSSNPGVRDTLLDIIEDEADSKVLTRALGAFGSQSTATSAQRQQLLGRATELVSHQDALVRSRSYTALAGWADSSNFTPQILEGLSDPDSRVRRDLTYSLINYQYVDGQVKRALMGVASNDAEIQRTRRGALQALSRISLTDDERAQLREVLAQVNSTRIDQ